MRRSREPELTFSYKGQTLRSCYRPDFICCDSLIVELKALKTLTSIEESQMINYLKESGCSVGLPVNFAAESLQYKRFANTGAKNTKRLPASRSESSALANATA